jgi:hypothetical protein
MMAIESTLHFPKSITVRVVPPPTRALAVGIYFEMSKKNNFAYTAFLDEGGVANIPGEQLLKTFDATRFLFLMDYVDPRNNFTGKVTAKVLSNLELRRAMEAFEIFRGKVAFPTDYEENLKAAANWGQNPDDYHVNVVAE